jgi:hypothetical protein
VYTECTKIVFFNDTHCHNTYSSYKRKVRLFCADLYKAYKYSTTLRTHAYNELNPNQNISVEYTFRDIFTLLRTVWLSQNRFSWKLPLRNVDFKVILCRLFTNQTKNAKERHKTKFQMLPQHSRTPKMINTVIFISLIKNFDQTV